MHARLGVVNVCAVYPSPDTWSRPAPIGGSFLLRTWRLQTRIGRSEIAKRFSEEVAGTDWGIFWPALGGGVGFFGEFRPGVDEGWVWWLGGGCRTVFERFSADGSGRWSYGRRRPPVDLIKREPSALRREAQALLYADVHWSAALLAG